MEMRRVICKQSCQPFYVFDFATVKTVSVSISLVSDYLSTQTTKYGVTTKNLVAVELASYKIAAAPEVQQNNKSLREEVP